jgi:hypothetical protein
MGIIIGGKTLSGINFNTLGETPKTPNVVTDGLVLWLDAGNDASYINSSNYYDCGYGCQYYSSNPGCTSCNTQWKDMSGNGNDGVPTNGPVIGYNSNGGSMVFDGVNDYFNIPSFINKPSGQITCDAWIYPTKPTISGTIRGGVVSATSNMYLGIIDSIDGGVTFALHWANNTNNGSQRPASWHGNVPNNTWSYITGTYDGGTSRAYVNGVEVWSASQTGPVPDSTYVIGTYGPTLTDVTHNFNGYVAIARIYNRGLTITELLQNYNNERARFGV